MLNWVQLPEPPFLRHFPGHRVHKKQFQKEFRVGQASLYSVDCAERGYALEALRDQQICDGCKSLATNKKLLELLDNMAVSAKDQCHYVWMPHWQLTERCEDHQRSAAALRAKVYNEAQKAQAQKEGKFYPFLVGGDPIETFHGMVRTVHHNADLASVPNLLYRPQMLDSYSILTLMVRDCMWGRKLSILT